MVSVRTFGVMNDHVLFYVCKLPDQTYGCSDLKIDIFTFTFKAAELQFSPLLDLYDTSARGVMNLLYPSQLSS